jgi:hypothetical protein
VPSDFVGSPLTKNATVPVGVPPLAETTAVKLTVAVELPSAIDVGVAVSAVVVGPVTVIGQALLVEPM